MEYWLPRYSNRLATRPDDMTVWLWRQYFECHFNTTTPHRLRCLFHLQLHIVCATFVVSWALRVGQKILRSWQIS